MEIIYKMTWRRFDLTTPWFSEGYKDGIYKDFHFDFFNKMSSENTARKWTRTVSEDRYELTVIFETDSIEDFNYCKNAVEKKFPNYFEIELQYNLEHGIFCDPDRCGISVDGGPFMFSDGTN
jgi:hypothetical protein